MGPTLCVLAKNAAKKAGIEKRVIAVSRFSDPIALQYLHENGVETVSADLLDTDALAALPNVKNVIFMAGRKFGTDGEEHLTWAMNASLPAFTARKFRNSRIVVFSSGNVYPLADISSGGCIETDAPGPIGEYTMSCLARERAFEYAANTYGTKVLIFRLNFAVDLRYGVLHDIAERILAGEPVSLTTPLFNCIWQGSANEYAVRSLLHADSPMKILNITGPETISVKWAAERLGEYLGKTPTYAGEPSGSAYLNNASEAMALFGYPAVPIHTLVKWQAEWILAGGRSLGKPTHFEERKGSY
jgi:nucleoside-diphosphate-sugar epimerase